MFVPSPNHLDYLIWAAQRTDAGTDDDIYYYDDWDADIIVEASWTIQTVLDGVACFGDESTLEFEDLTLQFETRAGVEVRPWELETRGPLDELAVGYQPMDAEELDPEYDPYCEEEQEEETRSIILPITETYRPDSQVGGTAFVGDRPFVVWGDYLWEARRGEELQPVVELPAFCQLYCAFGSKLVLDVAHDFFIYDVEVGEFVRAELEVPIFRNEEYATEARTLGQDDWTPLPVCVSARFVDLSPCGGFVRVKDRLGKGGIFDTATWMRVGNAGGPFRDEVPPQTGPKLGGSTMRRRDWTQLARQMRRRKLRVGDSACCWLHGCARYTDNGLTFYEDERLLLVLDEPVSNVSFDATGRIVIGNRGDEVVRIDLDAKDIVDVWQRPARLQYLRSFLPEYQPDAYVEQIVALWEVLAEPNAKTCVAS